jgi:hypothetical protein
VSLSLPLVFYLLLSSPTFLSASMSDLAQIKQRSCQVTDASLSFDGEASSDPLYISLFPACCDVSSRCLASSPTIFIQPLGGFLGHKLWPGWKQCCWPQQRMQVPLPPWEHGHVLNCVFLFSGAGENRSWLPDHALVAP